MYNLYRTNLKLCEQIIKIFLLERLIVKKKLIANQWSSYILEYLFLTKLYK